MAGENSVMPPWVRHQFPESGACQWRSKKGPPWRCKKGPLGGCGLVPVVHGRAPRATGASPGATPPDFSNSGSASRGSGRSRRAGTGAPSRKPSSRRRSPSPRFSESSRPVRASRSATSCRRSPCIIGPARSPSSSRRSSRSWPTRLQACNGRESRPASPSTASCRSPSVMKRSTRSASATRPCCSSLPNS